VQPGPYQAPPGIWISYRGSAPFTASSKLLCGDALRDRDGSCIACTPSRRQMASQQAVPGGEEIRQPFAGDSGGSPALKAGAGWLRAISQLPYYTSVIPDSPGPPALRATPKSGRLRLQQAYWRRLPLRLGAVRDTVYIFMNWQPARQNPHCRAPGSAHYSKLIQAARGDQQSPASPRLRVARQRI
jgi:hypothetical protein